MTYVYLKKVYMSSLFLKSFAGYTVLGWQFFFSLCTGKHCSTISLSFSLKRSQLQSDCCFVSCSSEFLFVFGFQFHYDEARGSFLFIYPDWYKLCFLHLWVHFWNILSHYLLKYYLFSILCLLSFWGLDFLPYLTT